MNVITPPAEISADPRDALEATCGRLRELRAVLQAINSAELLSELPTGVTVRERHQVGVSLLSLMSRDLDALIMDVEEAAAPRTRRSH